MNSLNSDNTSGYDVPVVLPHDYISYSSSLGCCTTWLTFYRYVLRVENKKLYKNLQDTFNESIVVNYFAKAAAIAVGLDNTTTAAQLCKACFHPNVNFGHIVMEDCSANQMHKFNERLLEGQEFASDVVANRLRTMKSSGRATETTEESNSIMMVGRLPTAVDVGPDNALIHGNWVFKVSLGGDVTSVEPNPAAPPAPQSVAPTALPADVFCSPAGVPVVPYPVEGQEAVLLQHALPVWRAMFLRTVWTFVLKNKATNLLANNLEYVHEVANELRRLLRVTPQRQYAFGALTNMQECVFVAVCVEDRYESTEYNSYHALIRGDKLAAELASFLSMCPTALGTCALKPLAHFVPADYVGQGCFWGKGDTQILS